jgi:hypothetical protein
MADVDHDDGAALARSFWAECLKMLANLAHQSPDPEARDYAWLVLQRGLVQIRQFIAAPDTEAAARRDAIEALRGFLDS